MKVDEINENIENEDNFKENDLKEIADKDNGISVKNEDTNDNNEQKLKLNFSSNFSNQNQNLRNNIYSNTNDISNEETNKVNINTNSFHENNDDNKQKSDICINKLSSFNENLNQIEDDIINEQNDIYPNMFTLSVNKIDIYKICCLYFF